MCEQELSNKNHFLSTKNLEAHPAVTTLCEGGILPDKLDKYDIFPIIISLTCCGSNSVVECNLAKVDVAGSNPVSRSSKLALKPLHPRKTSFPLLIPQAEGGSSPLCSREPPPLSVSLRIPEALY